MGKSNPCRPQITDLLELERGVPQIPLEELEVLIRKLADIIR